MSEPIATDALVIGAGPAGLFQVFQLGLQALHAEVVDSLPEAGGQCTALYADKPIYDIPGTPVCTGRELTTSLLRQIEPFRPGFHWNVEITALRREADGRFHVEGSNGSRFVARAVFLAGGIGAFQPRRLKLEGIEAFDGRQVFYRAGDVSHCAGAATLVIGDDDIALEAAIRLAEPGPQQAARVTLMHRRDRFTAEPATQARFQALREAGALSFIAAQARAIEVENGRLTGLVVDASDGTTQHVALDKVLVLLGLSPKLGPLADWGLVLERKQVPVDTERFETAVPGLYAIGDVCTYPGKKKLILSGFHEATLAAFAAAARLHPERPQHLEYTTTSPRLQRALGVWRETPRD